MRVAAAAAAAAAAADEDKEEEDGEEEAGEEEEEGGSEGMPELEGDVHGGEELEVCSRIRASPAVVASNIC